jgi:polysaccharide deacetylase family protein (PEP-CTERM system associated)
MPEAPIVNAPIINALSVDVEDYYQVSAFDGVVRREDWPRYPSRVVDNTRRVLDLFAAHRATGTFFILGCVARAHPGLVRAIADAGHEVASHGFGHHRVASLGPRAFADDVRTTRRLLEDLSGRAVTGYRAPSFSIGRDSWWAFPALAEAGYRYSSSVSPFQSDHYGVKDAPRFAFDPVPGFTEIPITTVQLGARRLPCAGGGFFRLLPYGWTRWGLQRLHARDRQPAMFYFHPWEIDPAQPRIPGAPARSRLRHYTGLGGMAGKLGRLLDDFRWSRIDTVFLPEIARRAA